MKTEVKIKSVIISILSVISIIITLSSVSPLYAESGIYDKIGLIVEHGLHGAVPEENIDLFTGNLTLRNLDIQLPGPNGFDLKIWRVYNSKIVKDRLAGSGWAIQQEPYSWVGIGWSMHMGRVRNFNSLNPVIEFPDGRWETTYSDPNGTDNITRDLARYDKSAFKLYFKDGTIWTFGAVAYLNLGGANQEQIRVVTQIENSFGHTINVQYDGIGSPNIDKITDSMGRVVDFTSSNNKLTRISVKNTNGTLVYYDYTVETFNGDFHKLTSFEPPVIPPVTYEYEDGNTSNWKLTAVNTSYGGRMGYTYVDHTFYHQVLALETRVVNTKSIQLESGDPLSTWSYTYPDYRNVSEGTTVVNGPVYNTEATFHAYSSGAPWKVGLLKKKRFTDGSFMQENQWLGHQISNDTWTVISIPMGTIKSPLLQKTITSRAGDANSMEEYLYERSDVLKYGLPTKIKYYGGANGSTLKSYKTLEYAFESNSFFKNTKYMVTLVSNETVKDSSNSKLSETQTEYYTSTGKCGAIDKIQKWRDGNTYLEWDYTYSSSNPNLITITINLPGTGGTETHKYKYGIQSDLIRPGFTEYSRTISQHNSAIKSETNQHGGTINYTYDDLDRITKASYPGTMNDINASWSTNSVSITRGGYKMEKYWDGLGRDLGFKEIGDGITLYYRKTLDAEGRILNESKGSKDSSDVYSYTYNATGNPTQITDPEKNKTTITYIGNLKTVIDAKSHTTTFTFTHLPGKFTTLTDAQNHDAIYTYDGTGQLTSIQFASKNHSYVFNGLGMLKSESHPETGTITYTYDAANNLDLKEWDTVTLDYTYNTSNQLTKLNDGSEILDYIYDTNGRVKNISSNKGWSRTNILYDSMGAITSETQYTDSVTGSLTTTYEYDSNNNLKSITYPSGRKSTVTSNSLNMPESLTFNAKNIISQTTYGISKQPVFIDIAGNATKFDATYNKLGAMLSSNIKKGSATLYDSEYRYDKAGNVKYFSSSDIYGNFIYDELNRLTDANYAPKRFSYHYDTAGNLLWAKENNQTVFNSSYNSKNQLNSTSYSYDTRGNLTAAPGFTQTWDKRNRMSSISRSTGETVGLFLYNERDLRLKASRYVPPPASITVTAPTAASTWEKESQVDITWESTGKVSNYVSIMLYFGEELAYEITTNTLNDGLFQWTVPDILPERQYTVCVSSLDGKIKGCSQEFAISKSVPPAVNPFSKDTGFIGVGGLINTFGISWADINNDGIQDFFLANRNLNNSLYFSDPQTGIYTKDGNDTINRNGGDSFSATFGDYDNDGFVDIFIANYTNSESFLFRNNNGTGTFIPINNYPMVTGSKDTVCSAWADYDNDGYLDLFVSNRNQKNALYKNSAGTGFTEINAYPFSDDIGDSRSCNWVDIDNDGDLDLFVAHTMQNNSLLYRNNGDGSFSKILNDPTVTDYGDSYSSSFADYDNDGDLDLFVVNYSNQTNILYKNDGRGNFSRVDDSIVSSENSNSISAAWGDYDNDGDTDLLVANVQQPYFLYSNNGDGTFSKVQSGALTNEISSARGITFADPDNDGDLDVFVANTQNQQNGYFQNGGTGNNWIGIHCVGVTSNTTAIGARVKVKATINGVTTWQMREITSQTGYLSQSDMRAHFGLGGAASTEEIRVEWPSGAVNRLSNLTINQYHTITEPTSTALTLKSPIGGEVWRADTTQYITWSSVGVVGDVKLDFSFNDGSTWVSITDSTENDGLYEWVIPVLPASSTLCRVRVSSLDDTYSNYSSDTFTMIASTDPLTITSPNGGEEWPLWSTQTIQWFSTSPDSHVKLEYSVDNGATYNTIVLLTENDGSYPWLIPDSASTQCLLRITETKGDYSDTSDSVFTIGSGGNTSPLRLVGPNGGESLMAGMTYSIQWQPGVSSGDVMLEFSDDNGTNWTSIVDSTPNTGSYAWLVPNITSNQCLVRLSEIGGTFTDTSDAVFSITYILNYLTLVTPNNSSMWTRGETYDITWTTTQSPGNVKIQVSYINYNDWITITDSTPDDGVYSWTVPADAPLTAYCRVRIDAADGSPGYTSISPAPFAIIAPAVDNFTRVTTGPVANDGGDTFGVAWADYNYDGHLDLVVTNRFSNNALYKNLGNGEFLKVTDSPVSNDGGDSYSASWGDYNNDGTLDLLIANYGNENNFLYKNTAGVLTKVTTGPLVTDAGYTAAATWGDYDNDGWLDVYAADQNGYNRLYHNNADGGSGTTTFSKITSINVVNGSSRTFHAGWNDFNRDGNQDLFVLTPHGSANEWYAGSGGGSFTQYNNWLADDLGDVRGFSFGDYTNTRSEDLFIATRDGLNYLYKGSYSSGSFTKVTTGPIATVGFDAMGSAWGDYDNDGDLDLVVAASTRNRLYRNEGNGRFTEIVNGATVTDSNFSCGIAWGDCNNDGYLDLVVANRYGQNNSLFRNKGGSNNWIKIKLVGMSSNKSAIGARVAIRSTIDGRTVYQQRVIYGLTGRAGQNSPIVHFGLKDGTTVEQLSVHWPGAPWELYQGIPANQTITITQGQNITGQGAEINVKANQISIPSGGTMDFGYVPINSQKDVQFHIENNGWTILNLTSTPRVVITGTDAADFSVEQDPMSTVSPGGSTYFIIRYTSSTDGLKTAQLNIANSDTDENPYIIALTASSSPTANQLTGLTIGPVVTSGGNSFAGAWGDYDKDGLPDLFVANNGANNGLYRNNGSGSFTAVTTGPVVTDGGSSYCGSWGDYDNDGDADLFVGNSGGENNFLYQNNGDGTFTKITTGPVVTTGGDSYSSSWVDYDRDGHLDLYVANKGQGNFLFRNTGGGVFTQITTGEIVTGAENSINCAWADYDNNGYPDLFVANKLELNSLFRNNGDGTFTRITNDPVATDVGDSYSGSWADYDNDGFLDLFVANWGNQKNFLYRNNGNGSFTKVIGDPTVTENGDSSSSAWADYDNDGDLDLYVTNKNITPSNSLYQNNGNGTFTKITVGAVVTDEFQSQATSWEDIDNDGDTDLLVANLNQNNNLYANSGSGNNWVLFTFTPTTTNGSALGVRIKLKATINGQVVWQMRELTGSTGLGGQASPRASFGLGNAQDIEEIIVNWPSGITQSFYNVAINQLAAISETNGFIGRKTPESILRKLYSRAEKTNRRTGDNGYPYDNSGNAYDSNDTELLNFTPRLGYNLFDEYKEGHGPFGPFAGTIESITGGAAHQSGQNLSANSATIQSLQLSTSYYLYSYDDRLLAEYDATGTCIKEYIYFGGKMVAEYQPQTNKYYYYHSDQINSTRVVTDDTGQKVYDHFFGPFGEDLITFKETYDPKLKFSGKEREPEGELDYFGARYYQHSTYRFNSVDPIINKAEALSNPQLWNLYAYCRNNPISYIDPEGRVSTFAFQKGLEAIMLDNFNMGLVHLHLKGKANARYRNEELGVYLYDFKYKIWKGTVDRKLRTSPKKPPESGVRASAHIHPPESTVLPNDGDYEFTSGYWHKKDGRRIHPLVGKPNYVVHRDGVGKCDPLKVKNKGRFSIVYNEKQWKNIIKIYSTRIKGKK
jgi:enediyne biosynthesis protein E4